MTVRAQDVIHNSEASGSALTRREGELRELVDKLLSQLAECVERERILELEVVSQLRELEVRFAFEATLEKRLLEYQHQIACLHGRVEIDAQRFTAEQQRFAAEATSVRKHVADALRERDELQRELDAERWRISYRAVQSVVVRVKKHRVFFALLRRAVRVFGRSEANFAEEL